MTIQEDAERLRAIASSEYLPIEITRQMQTRLLDINTAVMGILGQTEQGQHITQLVGVAAESFNQTIGALQQLETAIHDAADYHARG